MPSFVLGRFFLPLFPLGDVLLMIAALNAVDHEVKGVMRATSPLSWIAGYTST
jgi:hypothetical protein